MYNRYRQATISLIYMALAAASMLPLTTFGDEAHFEAAPPPAERLATGTETASVQVVIGDSVASVQQALHTSITPTITADANKQYAGQIRLPERGIWVFFDQLSKAYQFRFDAPFRGDIRGAKIGASIEQVNAVMGAPIREIPVPHSLSGKSYLYRVDPGTEIRCDFDQNQRLATIRVLTGTVAFVEENTNAVEPLVGHRPVAPVITRQNNVTQLTIPGSLAATHNLGCVAFEAIDKSIQPPDLYKAIPQCITAGRYPDAVELFMLAGLEVRFDSTRVTDKTAGQAGQVMIMNTFNPLPQEQREKFTETLNALIAEPKTLTQVCEGAQKLGPPTYYPEYMILHGIKAFTGDPRVNAIDTAMNGQAVWTQIQHTYLNCPT
jgi:hypothetical protein